MGKKSSLEFHVGSGLTPKSSTEIKIVVVDDASGKILWCNHFIGSLGDEVNSAAVYQDNQSAILSEKNGKEVSIHVI